ncbi:MAG TPA: 5-oxoprolinase subunit PxpA [Thermoanaerobaculia bacterium]|nr:5-oxoprolinase subunit PxpA [Thermoanaerobaculia bacterium]
MESGSPEAARPVVVEISCDLGEAESAADREVERSLWPFVDAANVACGGHAGNEETMAEAARRARQLDRVLGAHPSFPDREGFGRRRIDIAPEALKAALVGQLAALAQAASAEGTAVERIKPHGALYNEAHHDEVLARTIVEAVVSFDPTLALVAAPGSRLLAAGAEAGLGTFAEAFADRRYRPDGSLVPRGEPDALLLDPAEAADQATRLATRGVVLAKGGVEIAVRFDTLCIHGDMEGSVERLRAVRAALESAGVGMGVRR